MGILLNVLGIVIIAIGTSLMMWGNIILSKEKDELLEAYLQKQFETTKIEQLAKTELIVSKYGNIKLVIQNLTMPEKYLLLMFIKGYERMDKKAIIRMLKSFKENLTPPFSVEINPFQDIIDSLVRKDIILTEGITIKFTPLGQEIINNLKENKIPPFDEI